MTISAANLHDSCAALPTIDAVAKSVPCRRKRPKNCCLDKAYDCADIDSGLKRRGIRPHSRRRGEEPRSCRRGKPRRWKVERTTSWHNRFRAVLIRWEVKPEHYRALVLLASAIIAFRTALC